jgi:hypothetical protein
MSRSQLRGGVDAARFFSLPGCLAMKRYLAAVLVLASTGAGQANDSIAELGAGGLILARTDAVAMEKEVLSISPTLVTVDYVFRNTSDKDVTTVVAFPMPEIVGNPYEFPAVPKDPDDNFLGFSVTIDGKPVTPQLEQKAFAMGVDVTEELTSKGVPLYPNGDKVYAALAKVPPEVTEAWVDRGMVIPDEYDDGSGMKKVMSPFWAMRSTYWWRATFPAGKTVAVSHRYAPSVGGSAGLNFLGSDGKPGGSGLDDYVEKYCLDKPIIDAVRKSAEANPDGYPEFYESRISYVLTTGGNWATGAIGDFTLKVDKGDPAALVSFCGQDVRKTGPTTFEMTAKDFYPEHDVDILILKKPDWNDNSQESEKPVDVPEQDSAAPAEESANPTEEAAPKASPGASLSGG